MKILGQNREFWMYSPANRVFFFLKMLYHPDHVHTMYTIQHFLHAIYFRCYNKYMIEENDKLFSLT